MTQPKLLYNNCLLAILYLFLRGKVAKIALAKSNSIWPHHYICITKSGFYIDFQHVKDLSTSNVPFWFLGRYIIYKNPKKKIIRIVENPKIFIAKLIAAYIILYLPFMIWFGVEKSWFCTRSAWDAVWRNKWIKYIYI